MTPEEINEIFYSLVTDTKQALERGLKDRERITKMIECGEQPFGHRIDWIRETAGALNKTMIKQTEAFNQKYRGDRISVADMCDVLTTLLEAYKKAL